MLCAEPVHVQARSLPELPAHARYMRHSSDCSGWGAFGWALGPGGVDPNGYEYYVLVDSSARGPFLPPYLQVWCLSFKH